MRFIAPAYPDVNIFTRAAARMAPLGIVSVATAANKVWGFRVEIIDENNYRGPCDEKGLPDHAELQKENPASVMCMYCGLSSTMDRVFELSKFYADQGCVNIAGGWHAHYCPQEVLEHHFGFVVHGDGEVAIREILEAIKQQGDFTEIPGISFWDPKDSDRIARNLPERLDLPDLNLLPYPDFGLIRHGGKIKTYPIGRVRGCRMNCEFCSVKGEPRWVNPEYVFNLVNWLVETRGARYFFIVDDRLEENEEGLLEFFRLIEKKYGAHLRFTVQVRLETAKNISFLESMKRAGIENVCVGFESPIDEDLKAMRKGLLSKKMVEWTRILRRYFWVHGMFIFGYPTGRKSELSVDQKIERFKKFIRQAGLSTVQILHPVPLVGTDLRARLLRENRIFPLDVVPWSKYDGNFACFVPDDMSVAELQEAPLKLMKWFYSSLSFLRIPIRTVLFPIHYLFAGWHHWYHGWLREIFRYGGHRLIAQWHARQENRLFSIKLEAFAESKKRAD